MKRHSMNVPVILAIVLNLLAAGVLQMATPTAGERTRRGGAG